MNRKCKYCELDFDNEDPEWRRWNEKTSEYCSEDYMGLDEYFENIDAVIPQTKED